MADAGATAAKRARTNARAPRVPPDDPAPASTQIAADDDAILTTGYDSENASLPLNLTAAARGRTILADALSMPVQGASPRMTVFEALGSLPLTLNNHHDAVSPADFAANARLSSAFEVLSTNVDRTGRPFVSMVEARGGVPIWATQWHPEKNIFEQGVVLPQGYPYEAIHHSRAAVAVSQYLANFFVDRARRSDRTFANATDEWARLMYQRNASTLFRPAFMQVYLFD